jgi:hypothetical protein
MEPKRSSLSTGTVLREVVDSTKDLAEAEFAATVHDLKKHTKETVLSGILVMVSIPPFLAFLVIGLGEWMNGRYWLSALTVSLLCLLIGVPLARRSIRKLTKEDYTLPHTRRSLQKIQERFSDFKITRRKL